MTDPTAAAKLLPCPLSDDQIRHMVDRFLGWRLPKPWNPDNGISYVRPNYMHPPADYDWPTGTNLFDWSQAEAMVRYMLEGLPMSDARPKVEDAEVVKHVAFFRDLAMWFRSDTMFQEADECDKAADLLERLAGDRTEWINRAKNEFDAHLDTQARLQAAEAKLAARQQQKDKR